MKRTYKLLLLMTFICMFIFCGIVSTSALDANGKCGDDVIYTYDQDTRELIISGTGKIYDEFIDFNESDIQSVVIKNGVTGIGSYAFARCHDINSVSLPETLTSINDGAFFYCDSLESIIIPSKVESIGNKVFQWCDSLIYISVNSNNETFSSENGILFNKNKTKIVVYPDGKTSTTYTIPNSVTHIGDYAFCDSNLKKVTISGNVVNIGYNAFGNCTSLKDITIPGSVKNIGAFAFSGCLYLTKVIIEAGVENVGESAFSTCSALSEITLPATIKVIAKDAFANCIFLKKVNFNGTRAQWNAIKIKTGNTALTSASIEILDDCACHSVGLSRWIFKFKVFFWRFIGKNRQCVCGAAHY